MTTAVRSMEQQDRVPDTAAYVYEPLPNDCAIRLIQICPDKTLAHGFSLVVKISSLKEAPAFCCLSYTWKSAKFSSPEDYDNDEVAATFNVNCGEKNITINENLFDFLCRARDESWFTPNNVDRDFQHVLELSSGQTTAALPSYLWVDALSINQNDTRERSHQVSMMGNIYSSSQMVLVWLGKEDPSPGAERVFRNFIPRFLALVKSDGLASFEGKDPFCDDPDLIRQLGEDICSQWKEDWMSFFLFLVRCRWFRRGWVVQEVILKSLNNFDQVIVLCGSLGILWIDLSYFLAWLTKLNWRATLTRRLRSHEATKEWGFHFSKILQSANAVLVTRNWVEECSLGKTSISHQRQFGSHLTSSERIYSMFFRIVTLMGSRTVEFSDKRDTIYGFLGLLSAVLPHGTSSPIRVDYSLSDVDVLTNEVWHMVSNMPYLDILSMTQCTVLGVDHPSWVPDFSVEFFGVNLQQIRDSYGRAQFDASMMKSPCSSFRLTGGRGLTLVGTKVMDIAANGIPLYANKPEMSSIESLLEVLLGQQRNYLPLHEPRDKALCRTLVADTFPSALDETQWCTVFRDWWTNAIARRVGRSGSWEHIASLFLKLGRNWDWLPSLDEVLDAADKFGLGNELPSSPVEMVIHRLWARRAFFHTKTGHFGLGPLKLEIMDEVWLFKGGRTPFVLRKRAGNNDYHFIGEAYVHGLMYGEAATSVLNQKMGLVTIF
ncbi:hypothetical protein BP6252_01544 [Coleophoma cylindrospora]|uniref:Heterokaryon incompatibility domain-containing protein n=1 Tax=Coleophoma cylindrospora TaxID=1849047 RepID=A0A3D8ST90_9HELO|nr:hypothetical protein BP6252_01544 [Coleophoma cylindrospora]